MPGSAYAVHDGAEVAILQQFDADTGGASNLIDWTNNDPTAWAPPGNVIWNNDFTKSVTQIYRSHFEFR